MGPRLQDLSQAVASGDPTCLLEVFTALRPLVDTPQDPSWHSEGSVWNHTKMVFRALLDLPGFRDASEESRHVMAMAAVFHDVAKASCTKMVEGRLRSVGHPRRGSIDVRTILWRLGYSRELRERIARIVASHHVAYHAFTDPIKTAEWKARKLSWEVVPSELVTVCLADASGRITDPAKAKQESIDSTLLFAEVFKELNCWDKPYVFPDDHTRIKYFRNFVYPDQPFYQEPGSKVIVMSGLPASGKDTLAKGFGLPIVSFDDTREDLDLEYGDNDGLVAQTTIAKAKDFLRKHEPFVWNATNINSQMRQKTLGLLFDYHAEVVIHSLDLEETTLRQRNRNRDTTVLNKTIDNMLLKWEPPLPTEAHEVLYIDRSL